MPTDITSRNIFNNDVGGNKTGLTNESFRTLKKKKIPRSIIKKMNMGVELEEFEKDVLHNQGIEYVRGEKVTPHIRKYTGGTPARLCNLKLANIKRGI